MRGLWAKLHGIRHVLSFGHECVQAAIRFARQKSELSNLECGRLLDVALARRFQLSYGRTADHPDSKSFFDFVPSILILSVPSLCQNLASAALLCQN